MRQDRIGDGLDLGEAILGELESEQRGGRWLELGRQQRRDGHRRAAARSLQLAVADLPLRLDARRELAEVLIELGRRGTARRVLVQPVPSEAAQEHLLDLVQYLVSQRMLNQAALVLTERQTIDPRNLEIRLRLLRVYGRLAAGRQGLITQTEARPLADTPARYRRWLEAALTLHEELDDVDVFLGGEVERLAADEDRWSERGLGRLDVLVEVAERVEPAIAGAALSAALTNQPPAEAAAWWNGAWLMCRLRWINRRPKWSLCLSVWSTVMILNASSIEHGWH